MNITVTEFKSKIAVCHDVLSSFGDKLDVVISYEYIRFFLTTEIFKCHELDLEIEKTNNFYILTDKNNNLESICVQLIKYI
jgi:hypothetical protein